MTMTAEETRLLQKSPLRIEPYLIKIEAEIREHCLNADTGYIFHPIAEKEKFHIPAIMEALKRLGFGVELRDETLKIDWFKAV